MTITGCEGQEAAKIMYIVQAALSGVVSIVAIILLYWRICYKHQTMFDFRAGFIRPKPIESMGLFGVLFNLLRMVQSIIYVADVLPNPIFRSFMFEVPWQFGFCALACYLFGTAHTLSDTSATIYTVWVRSPVIIDTICVLVIALPFITNTICSLLAGMYAEQGDIASAKAYTSAIYYLWSFYTAFLGLLIVFAGIRLIRLLYYHLEMQTDLRVNGAKIKTGVLKVKIVVLVGAACLWLYSIVAAMYAAFRDPITKNMPMVVLICILWMYMGALTTLMIEFAIILNPQMAKALVNLSFGSYTSDTQTDPLESVTLSQNEDMFTSFELASTSKAHGTEWNKAQYESESSKLEKDRIQYNTVTRKQHHCFMHHAERSVDITESQTSSIFNDSTTSAIQLTNSTQ
ncbi:hypothetical protein EC973_007023 [Apophysomyces ossiformis]|uniref:Uncharacterized protein n=1 Tax=Apophysomyces ossiformis TaxID=679940 RepID=A0A8H7BQA5_9FUNG|nr:hypothetical protein EC973_007023 [Apophysomyces ossiformis]